MNCQDKCEE